MVVAARRGGDVGVLRALLGPLRFSTRRWGRRPAVRARLPGLLRLPVAGRPPGARPHARGDPRRDLRLHLRRCAGGRGAPRPARRDRLSDRRRLAGNAARRRQRDRARGRHPRRGSGGARRLDAAPEPPRARGVGRGRRRRVRAVEFSGGGEERVPRLAALGLLQPPPEAGQRPLCLGCELRGRAVSEARDDRAVDPRAEHARILARDRPRTFQRNALARVRLERDADRDSSAHPGGSTRPAQLGSAGCNRSRARGRSPHWREHPRRAQRQRAGSGRRAGRRPRARRTAAGPAVHNLELFGPADAGTTRARSSGVSRGADASRARA